MKYLTFYYPQESHNACIYEILHIITNTMQDKWLSLDENIFCLFNPTYTFAMNIIRYVKIGVYKANKLK